MTPISMDLRLRIFVARQSGETTAEVAERFDVSPAFVRRVIRDAGSEGIARLYFLPDDEDGIEYLLRRFKGHYYRNRYPRISLR